VPESLSRELGAFRPLGRSLKEEEPLSDEDVEEDVDAPEVPEAAPFDELFEELFSIEDDPAEEDDSAALADTPSDFAVSESSLPVAFMLLALW
jgi:hypothetical protein